MVRECHAAIPIARTVRLTNSDMFCLLTSAAKVPVPKVSHLSQVSSGKSKMEKITKLIITCKHHS